MQIEKRLIVFQTIISLSFLILQINYIFKNILNNNVLYYIGLSVFLILIIFSLLSLKLRKETIKISENSLTINKYITYFYIISYIFLLIQNRDNGINMKHYVLLSIVILGSLVGFIYNLVILLKNKFK